MILNRTWPNLYSIYIQISLRTYKTFLVGKKRKRWILKGYPAMFQDYI